MQYRESKSLLDGSGGSGVFYVFSVAVSARGCQRWLGSSLSKLSGATGTQIVTNQLEISPT
jgi:hypothetical protein